MDLADRRAMQRQRLADRRRDSHRAIVGLGRLQRHHAVAPHDRDEGALAAFVRDVGQNRARLPHQSHVVDIAASQVQALDSQAIVLGRPVLFDIAARLERGEQTKDVVLVQLEALGKFGDAEFVDLAEKLFEHVESVRNRLDDVVGFVAPDHGELSSNAAVTEQRIEPIWKNVLL